MGEHSLYDETRDSYLEILGPLFFPTDPFSHDIVRFFASLLRVSGMEDRGWDPYLESRSVLHDINSLMQIELPSTQFRDNLTTWRLGLILYNQIMEMSASYEVLMNLLRFRLKDGYSPNPFHKFMTEEERKRFKRTGLYPRQKIELIQKLSDKAELRVGAIFDDFARFDLRNAIAHADYIITEDEFRCRGSLPGQSFSLQLEELDRIITAAKAFASAFFMLEDEARRTWGAQARRGLPYDPTYKGIMEVLADDEGLLIGFKVHWPNGEESYYARRRDGFDMVNCFVSFPQETIELFVGMYASHADPFSPLVEKGGKPRYTPVHDSDAPLRWDAEAAAAKQPPLPEIRFDREVGVRSHD